MITPTETIEDKGTTPGQSAEAITEEQEVETQPVEETTTFPRQSIDVTIAKESTVDINPIRRRHPSSSKGGSQLEDLGIDRVVSLNIE